MANVNKVFLLGNLTRDPEAGTTGKGTKMSKFTVAVNEKYKDGQSGEMVEKSHYFDVTAFGTTAGVCNEYLAKGSPVFVEGKLELQRWEDKDGNKRSKVAVVALSIQLLPSGRRQETAGKPAPAPKKETVPPQDVPEEDDDMDVPF